MQDDNEVYNDLELTILIQDWLEEEPDEYWKATQEV